MKIFKLCIVLIVFSILVSGCVSSSGSSKPKNSLVREHIARGESLEKESRFSSALEQYKLALTIEPGNKLAEQRKKALMLMLWEKAQHHYQQGITFDKQGKHEAARKEYLSALQNWPDHTQAKKRLTPGGVTEESEKYIVHELKYGESVSKLGMIYYGDFKKYSVIGKFNVLSDVTKVRVGEKLKIPTIRGVSLSALQAKQAEYLKSIKTDGTESSQMSKSEIEPAAENKSDIEAEPIQETEMVKEADSVKETEPAAEEAPAEIEMMTLQKEEQIEEISQMPAAEEAQQVEDVLEETEQVAVEMPTSTADASEQIQQGVELFEKKKYSESISMLSAAAQIDPDNKRLNNYLFKSHFQQGLIFFNSEKYLLAKDNFESALKYDQSCGKCPGYIVKCETTYKEKHYNLGIHYFGKEQLTKAIKEWKFVQKLDPEYKAVTPNLQKAEMLYKRLESIRQSKPE